MATVLQWGGGAMQGSGINYLMVVHGEQRVALHRPLPTSGTIISDKRVIGAFDKGAGKGAVIVTEKKIRLKGTNEPLVTLVSSTFARGDGGFGGPSTGAPRAAPDTGAQARRHVRGLVPEENRPSRLCPLG